MLTIEQIAKEIEPELAKKEARLDIRLNVLYKQFLKQVYKAAGYRSLSAFILQAAIEKAEELIEKERQILATERDRTVFFEALVNPAEPNESLRKAAQSFKKSVS